jgi:hypothetical protein
MKSCFNFFISFDGLEEQKRISIQICYILPFYRCVEDFFVVENLFHILFYMFQVQFDFQDEYLSVQTKGTNREEDNSNQ